MWYNIIIYFRGDTMKKFIISDLHGNGNIYNSIMNFLENLNNDIDDDITLYINGDLIDRGEFSVEMLLDVKRRIMNNSGINIEYLAGNHELMMYKASKNVKNGRWPKFNQWFLYNGGRTTIEQLERLSIEEQNNVVKLISNLKICHKFEEKIGDKNIVLVHAKCPSNVDKVSNLNISDQFISRYLWSRDDSYIHHSMGSKDYFTIIGHTIVDSDTGYFYNSLDNTLNIDGGNAAYVLGYTKYDHSPLVEIDGDNNRLVILTFNNNNEIIYGNYFSDGKSISMDDSSLEEYRKYLKSNNQVKSLIKR